MTNELSDTEKAEVRGFRTGRRMALNDVWVALRDAPDGPMTDAMSVAMKLIEEMDRTDARPEDG